MFRRAMSERVKTIAPFLHYDRDPYMVIRDDGSLIWVWDAYTTADRLPLLTAARSGVNYIRNSVKVVIDAFNGDVTFYQIDPKDAAWPTPGDASTPACSRPETSCPPTSPAPALSRGHLHACRLMCWPRTT